MAKKVFDVRGFVVNHGHSKFVPLNVGGVKLRLEGQPKDGLPTDANLQTLAAGQKADMKFATPKGVTDGGIVTGGQRGSFTPTEATALLKGYAEAEETVEYEQA